MGSGQSWMWEVVGDRERWELNAAGRTGLGCILCVVYQILRWPVAGVRRPVSCQLEEWRTRGQRVAGRAGRRFNGYQIDTVSMNNQKLLNRLRAVAAAIAVLAFLIYLNTTQMEDEGERALRVVGAMNTAVTRVLHERHAAAVQNAWIEYIALVSVGLGAIVVVGAPRLVARASQ